MALYRCRAACRSGAQTGIDPTAHKLKTDQIHGSKRGCLMGCRMEGLDGVDPTVDKMNACQIYGSKSWCRTGCRVAKSTAENQDVGGEGKQGWQGRTKG
jgi:hypothetical protein